MRAALTDTGHIQLAFILINVSFEVQWANLLWESLSMPKDTERGQVLQQLHFVKELIPSKRLEWSPRQLEADLPYTLRIRGKLARVGRAWWN